MVQEGRPGGGATRTVRTLCLCDSQVTGQRPASLYISLSVVGVGSAEHSQPFFLKELPNPETPETRVTPDFLNFSSPPRRCSHRRLLQWRSYSEGSALTWRAPPSLSSRIRPPLIGIVCTLTAVRHAVAVTWPRASESRASTNEMTNCVVD